MKLVLLGADGQLGWDLRRALAPLGQLLALSRTMEGGDLSCMTDMARTIRQFYPDVIVNAAAYTAVDLAESQPEVAHAINGRAPGELAEIACGLGAWLVHYSTDYVFDGSGNTPWRETDAPRPLNVYGESKLEGEQAIRESGCRHLIFRTSWVFGRRGNNFIRTILRLADERDFMRIVDDQIGAPTGAALLADASAHAIRTAAHRPGVNGLYNLAASGETSWYDYARFIIDIAEKQGIRLKLSARGISPVTTAEYPTPAIRPLNSRLDTHRFTETFDLRLPPWESGVASTVTELLDGRSC
ncbi:dTDP-4-dehydrorhamnose reductase [Marinobacter salicampi]|uniref:dTDP-4-dehydrorhamnose reductase n=1 Tax=Marinobacter salicampi TaxID=435907 RepID=UPI00140AD8D9|nr:dTDP-4-dehydrorhamnose reductase [Marinobacter salicampi]